MADPFGTGQALYAHAFVVSPDGLAHETTTGWETAEAYFGFVIDRAKVPDFGPGPRCGVLEAGTAAARQTVSGSWGEAAALAVHRLAVRPHPYDALRNSDSEG